MPRVARNWLPWAVILAITLGLGIAQWRVAQALDNGLSRIANTEGEANTVRAGESYAVRGFGYAVGLPDKKFGTRFPELGYLQASSAGHHKLIETHYPPGAEWLAGLGTILFGVGEISAIRIIPIAFGVSGLIALGAGLLRFFPAEPWRAVLAFAITALIPMSYNMMHGLHHHEYTTAFYMMQIGVLLAVAANGFRVSGFQTAALFTLGFLQGWFSIDNAFIVCLASVPIYLAWRHRQAASLGLRQQALLILLPSVGYVLAHAIHLLQVIAYWGSIQATIKDYTDIAKYRVGAGDPRIDEFSETVELWWRYLVTWIPRKRFFGTPLLENLALFALLAWLSHGWLKAPDPATSTRRFYLDIRWGQLWGTLAAAAIASIWIFAMDQHALKHGNYIPRNFLLAYLIPLYALIDGVRWRPRSSP